MSKFITLDTLKSALTKFKENLSPSLAKLDSITGIVTADKLASPDHPTDLVAYDAFQAAVPRVQQMHISGATVGQTIKVKTVDTDGRPTSWEAADMVSGSGEVWEKVAEVTTTEEVASIELTLSDCTKICVVDNVPPFGSSDGKQASHLKILADDITVSVPTSYIAPHNTYPQTRSYWIIPLGDISWTFMTDATMNNPFRESAIKGNYADYSKTTISKIKYMVSVAHSSRYMIPAGTKVTVYGVKI